MFIQGKRYLRRELHATYGGQQQGGISTPRDHPLIFLFTGDVGEQYGYQDGWDSEGMFFYTGEGQQGDMQFVRGNRAIRDHVDEGKDLHLFHDVERGIVRYEGQMVYSGHEYRNAPDADGQEREVIVVKLLPIERMREENQDKEGKELTRQSLEELRALAKGEGSPSPVSSKSTIHVVHRSQAIKTYVRKRAGGTCEACNDEAPFETSSGEPYIEVHHIRRLSDGGPDLPEWVIGLCPNCHARAHYSVDKSQFNASFREIVMQKEKLEEGRDRHLPPSRDLRNSNPGVNFNRSCVNYAIKIDKQNDQLG